jgi:hypothetical protein
VVALVDPPKEQEPAMSTTPGEPEEPDEPIGVEVGFVEGEGTTFEPEEDPEGAGDG